MDAPSSVPGLRAWEGEPGRLPTARLPHLPSFDVKAAAKLGHTTKLMPGLQRQTASCAEQHQLVQKFKTMILP